MANPRNKLPDEITIVEVKTPVETKNAITLGAGETAISAVYDTVKAELITILTDISTGSIIVQKQMDNSSTGSWADIAIIVDDGLGSLIMDTATVGVIPKMRLVGSGLTGGSVLADVHYKTKLA